MPGSLAALTETADLTIIVSPPDPARYVVGQVYEHGAGTHLYFDKCLGSDADGRMWYFKTVREEARPIEDMYGLAAGWWKRRR